MVTATQGFSKLLVQKKRERETYIFYNFFFSSSRFFLVNWVLVRIKIKKKKSVIVLTHKLYKHLRLSA